MTASIAIRNRKRVCWIFYITSVPLLFISGISWPGAAIPPFWKYVSYIFPSTFGISGFVKINNMGATLSEVAFEYKALWLQAGILLPYHLLGISLANPYESQTCDREI